LELQPLGDRLGARAPVRGTSESARG